MPITINGTSGISGVDGSASTPAIQGGDSNTGVFFPAADTVAVTTGGAERVRVDSSGNVGIGTSSPTAKLSVEGSTALHEIVSINSFAQMRHTVGGVGAGGSYTQYYADNTPSFVGAIGTNVPGAAANTGLLFSTYTGSWQERARIGSGGEIRAASAGAYGLRQAVTAAAGTSVATFVGARSATSGNTGSGTDTFVVWSNGNVQNTNNSYGALSDAKLKENIVDATPKLEKLNQVRIVNFNLIGEEQKQLGVIAQELEQIFPGLVDETPDRDAEGNDLDTTTKSVKYSVFVPMLIKAIQELNAKVDAQAAEIAALKGASL